MADDASPSATAGQAGEGPAAPATDTAPEGGNGQATASSGNVGTGTTETDPDEASFFDPKAVPEELQPAYKLMQRAFTKKMQALAKDRGKVQFYDQLSADPVGNLQKLAAQYGLQLTRAQAQQMASQGQAAAGSTPADWQPQSWQEVLQKAEERAAERILGQLKPLLGEVQNIKKQSIEKQLEAIDPTWQQYEDEMIENLRSHPSLAGDPAKLYRLSVPQEVIESRATQAALRRFEAKAKSQGAAGGSTTSTKKLASFDVDQRFSSVAEAAEFAKRQLAERGKR
jgi:hypothetical protein